MSQGSGADSPLNNAQNPIAVVVCGRSFRDWRGFDRCLSGETGFSLVHCSEAPAEIVSYCRNLRPAVLIVDQPTLEEMDPAALLSLVNPKRSFHVIVKLDNETPEAVERLLRLGCAGFLGPRLRSSVVRKAVRCVAAGELWVGRRLVSELLQNLLFGNPRRLTEREQQILELIGEGYSNKDIASQLCISRETVRWHQKSLYAKIGVRDRPGAASFARSLFLSGERVSHSSRSKLAGTQKAIA